MTRPEPFDKLPWLEARIFHKKQNKNSMKAHQILVISATLFALAACEEKKSTPDKIKDKIDDVLDRRPNEKLKDAAEDAKDAIKDASKDLKDATKELKDGIKDATK